MNVSKNDSMTFDFSPVLLWRFVTSLSWESVLSEPVDAWCDLWRFCNRRKAYLVKIMSGEVSDLCNNQYRKCME